MIRTFYIALLRITINILNSIERILFTCDDCKWCNCCKDYPNICEEFWHKDIDDDERRR